MSWGAWSHLSLVVMLGAAGCLAGGCDNGVAISQHLHEGNHGQARVLAAQDCKTCGDRSDRNYLLSRMRLLIAALADGRPDCASAASDELFEMLTAHGINADRTVAAAVFNEQFIKIWKGEPFEQALALHYIATWHAMTGSWDNARAAAINAEFHLKDYYLRGVYWKDSRDPNLADILRCQPKGRGFQEPQYGVRRSNFALGYLMAGIASMQLAREKGESGLREDAAEHFSKARLCNPRLARLVQELIADNYNTLLVVDFGMAPHKERWGPDNSLSKFVVTSGSDLREITARVGGFTCGYPAACDVNMMALHHLWKSMEDVRRAKSILGDSLLMGGMFVASGGGRDSAVAGLVIIAVALAIKASAAADIRYCEALPQRVYLVPVSVASPGEKVSLQIPEGPSFPGSTMVLRGLSPPKGRTAQICYVRMLPEPPPPQAGKSQANPWQPSSAGSGWASWDSSPALVVSLEQARKWASFSYVFYYNDRCPMTESGLRLPFILGGHCIRKPTEEVLRGYQEAGFLQDMTLEQLVQLYRDEGIDQPGTERGLHVLEGGQSLDLPVAGSAGLGRLLGQPHKAYQPRTLKVRQMAEQVQQRLRTGTTTVPTKS